MRRRKLHFLPQASSASVPVRDDKPSGERLLLPIAAATMGALAFGFHIAVVNGPLEAVAADLGVLADKAQQGLVRYAAAPSMA